LYSFQGTPDGQQPDYGALLNYNGVFYGTTVRGGANNYGTIYQINASGVESVLYSFKGGNDGQYPLYGLVEYDGYLYGATSGDSMKFYGTVFSVDTSGNETVLHNFLGGTDGAVPQAGLTLFNGSLYGTTTGGGQYDRGTVFEIDTAGDENVIHSFGGASNEDYPTGSLLAYNNELYGTTSGNHNKNATENGTVFAISPTGEEHAIYRFQGEPDGEAPIGGLTALAGTLYGTTLFGGTGEGVGYGTVYSVTTSGTEKVLFRFNGTTDGGLPEATLLAYNNALYGVTGGGTHNEDGIVFKLTKSGVEKSLYQFKGGKDGSAPENALIEVNGLLYGTTENGGTANHGTVYSLTP